MSEEELEGIGDEDVAYPVGAKPKEVELLPLRDMIDGLSYSQRVYCLGVAVGLSKGECYELVRGFDVDRFVIGSGLFSDTLKHIAVYRERYADEARKMWKEMTEVLEEAFRMKMAALATTECNRRKINRDEFIIKEAVKLGVGRNRLDRSARLKKAAADGDAQAEIDHDDMILARANGGKPVE
jgi:hypothetical protein